ncbi:MAG: molybdopterin converting factor subunit 1 [Candidatus Angelobacter sp.]
MQIRVLFFGMLKDSAGRETEILDVPEGSTIGEVATQYAEQFPGIKALLPSLAVAVNQEYAAPETKLKDGDEVAFLPPVSGGLSEATEPPVAATAGAVIVREKISTNAVLARIRQPDDGAVVMFEGVVRNHTRNRRTLYLDYEAYEEMALKQMHALARQALAQFPVRDVWLEHRLGRLQVGETSVLIVVASAHRSAAFDASRWLIDTLKKTVPIWKKEYFEDGAVWADGEPFPEEIRGGKEISGVGGASNLSKPK